MWSLFTSVKDYFVPPTPQPSSPPPSRPLPERRRTTSWTKFSFGEWNEKSRKQLLDYAEGYWPLKNLGMGEDDKDFVNILLLGPINAGKTSFINTVSAAFQGRVVHQGQTGEETKSLTITFRKYPVSTTINKKDVRFRLCDCRGLEDESSVQIEDIEAILDGHMKDGYTLNSVKPIGEDDTHYKANPEISDKVHVVVFVVDSNNDPALLATANVRDQIQKVKTKLRYRGIPHFVLMNKVDGLKKDIRGNVELLFHYQSVKDRLDRIARNMNVAPLSVLPMCNYFEGTETRTDIDILTLYNLQQMLRMADDYLANIKPQIEKESRKDKSWTKFSFDGWNENSRKQLLEYAEGYSPLKNLGAGGREIEYVNILLLGPINAGKTSFVNTVSAAFQGRVVHQGQTGEETESHTLTFRKYPVFTTSAKGDLRFRLCDCRGLEDESSVQIKDIEAILDGHMEDGYQLNSGMSISKDDSHYKANPEISDRVHVVVFVIDSTNDPALLSTANVRDQIQRVKNELRYRGIPHFVLMNKVDGLKKDIRGNVELLFHYQSVKDRLDRIALNMNVAPLSVLPMCNYFEGTETRTDIDILTLYNLQQMLRMADDYLTNIKSQIEKESRKDKSWTKFSFNGWNEKSREQLLEYAAEYLPFQNIGMVEDDIECVNILLLGPINAGKTSFVNTISSVFKGRVVHLGQIGEETKSLTLKFRKYSIFTTSDKRDVRFRLCDCRGLEDESSVQIKDIEAILDGHMKDGYTLNSEMPIKEDDKHYKANPTISDKVHVVVFVVDSNNDPAMLATAQVKNQIQNIKDELRHRDIPHFVLMNKVDGLKKNIRDDAELLFRYRLVKDRLDQIARNMKVAPLSVLPMCNYFEGTETRTDIDILTLYNLQQMLRMADDYLANITPEIGKDPPLKTPWKIVDFSEESFRTKRDELEVYTPKLCKSINVLLVGPSDSRKSDFVNLFNHTIHHRITGYDVAFGDSSQRQFLKHKNIKRTDGSKLAIQFFDCVGFEDLSQLRSQELQQILDGKMKHGTQINFEQIDSAECQQVFDRIHCVLYAIPATMTLDDVKKQYSHLTETVRKSGIPHVALVTKVDTFRKTIKNYPEKIYLDSQAEQFTEKISSEMSIRKVRPMVHNDSDEFSEAHGILCLNAMQDVTEAADKYLENMLEDQDTFWALNSIRLYILIGFLIVVIALLKGGMDMMKNN